MLRVLLEIFEPATCHLGPWPANPSPSPFHSFSHRFGRGAGNNSASVSPETSDQGSRRKSKRKGESSGGGARPNQPTPHRSQNQKDCVALCFLPLEKKRRKKGSEMSLIPLEKNRCIKLRPFFWPAILVEILGIGSLLASFATNITAFDP